MSGHLTRDEFDYELCAEFSEFPESLAVEILRKYEEADLATIRNHRSFLKGILRRYQENGTFTASAQFRALPYSVQVKLETLISAGLLSQRDITKNCCKELSLFDEHIAVDILNRLQAADLRTVRCKSAYLMGIIQKRKQVLGRSKENYQSPPLECQPQY